MFILFNSKVDIVERDAIFESKASEKLHSF